MPNQGLWEKKKGWEPLYYRITEPLYVTATKEPDSMEMVFVLQPKAVMPQQIC
jgi:hypothetical protein